MRETTMKRNNILIGLALGMAVVLVGCSSNSPTAPKQPTPATYGISLTLSTPVAGINESVTAMAFVTVGGNPAPDGTSVTFTLAGNAFFVQIADPGVQVVTMTTSGGRASVAVVPLPAGGVVKVTASVPNSKDSKTITFTGGGIAGQPAIFSVMPNRAPAMTAGTQVVIHGQGLYQPQSVTFVVNGNNYAGQIVSFSADGTSITVSTPQAPVGAATIQVVLGAGSPVSAVGLFTFYDSTNPNGDQLPPVLYSVSPVTGSASGGEIITLTGAHFVNLTTVTFNFTDPNGTAKSLPAQIVSKQLGSGGANDTAQVVVPRASVNAVTQTIYVDLVLGSSVGSAQTYPRAFAYVPDVTTPPVIYSISPTFGSVQGHETVTIYGANFVQPLTVQIGTVNETVVSVSGDGTTITIMTQPVPGTPPTTAQDVTVTTNLGVATLKSAFTYLEGQAPQLYTLSPNNGPVEGGTRVTITGIGFQYPVQVLFGTQQAVVVSTNYDQVVCVSPSITPSQPTTPTTVQVSVTNITSGKVSQNTLPFQYGQAMFISGISPMQGPTTGGTSVTITGQGFVAPVSVVFNSPAGPQWSVLSVAGTQVVAKSAALPDARVCSGANAVLTVTNLDSKLSAISAQQYTYQGVNPLITSVVIDASGNTVKQYLPPTSGCTTPWSSHQVTINGSGFSTSGVTVRFGDTIAIPVPSSSTNLTATQIKLTLPDLTQLYDTAGLTAPSIQCTPNSGGCGNQWIPKGISVGVTNSDTNCSDSLANAIVINPCDTLCRSGNVTSLTLSLTVPGTQPVGGSGFGLNIGIAPAQTSPTTISFTCNPNFTCPTVTIPAMLTTGLATITATQPVTNGTIFATSGSGSCQATSNSLSVTAQTRIDVTAGVGGSVTSNPAGISCPATCSWTTVNVPSVTLTAAPSAGNGFSTWSGDCSGSNPISVLMMNGPKSCTATFLTVTSVSPNTGTTAGGTAVQVFGTGYKTGAGVTFGGVPATGVSWPSPTEIDCTTPAGAAGAVNVVVTNPDTQTATLTGGFTYF